ncbi:MAG: hypothetical protein LAT52_00825 [Balneolales bacterium]|nr:hypothetical protein [Balneolales bacterium]
MTSPQQQAEPVINYTREAFIHPMNLGFLFVSALTAFFVNDFGNMANIVFTMAIGAELVYLGVVPRTDAFRKRIMERAMKERPRDLEEKELFYNLNAPAQKRFLTLKHVADKIETNFRKFPDTSKGLTAQIKAKIDGLLSNYIYMLDSRDRYDMYISSTRGDELEKEIELVTKELGTLESEKIRDIKKRRLLILKKRTHKLVTARERLEICISQLETIEDAMRYIYEQSITMTNPEQIGFQLDNLLTDVEETVSIVEDLDDNTLPGFNIIENMDNFDDDILSQPKQSRQTQERS